MVGGCAATRGVGAGLGAGAGSYNLRRYIGTGVYFSLVYLIRIRVE